jgi:hypothetical protein
MPRINMLRSNSRDDAFLGRQKERRKELWELLGDLPWEHNPGPAKLVSKEEQEDYTLERLVLDLNGVEPVPALLLIPRKRQEPAPGLLYIHWHGGMYDLGKEMLLKGVEVAPAYAPVCAQQGLVTLAIDSWSETGLESAKQTYQELPIPDRSLVFGSGSVSRRCNQMAIHPLQSELAHLRQFYVGAIEQLYSERRLVPRTLWDRGERTSGLFR